MARNTIIGGGRTTKPLRDTDDLDNLPTCAEPSVKLSEYRRYLPGKPQDTASRPCVQCGEWFSYLRHQGGKFVNKTVCHECERRVRG